MFELFFFCIGERFRIDLDGFIDCIADVCKFSNMEGTIEEICQGWHEVVKTCGEVSEEEMKVWMLVSECWFSFEVECVLGEAFVVEEPIAKVVCAFVCGGGVRCGEVRVCAG